jgi:hypothetical protein
VADTLPVGVRNRKLCMELVQDYWLYSDDATLHNFFYQTKYFTVSRHIRTEKCSWSQCWFVGKNSDDSTLHKYLIWFLRNDRNFRYIRRRRKCKDDILQGTLMYMCAMLLLTRNPQIKLLSHDFLSHAWTKLFQTNWHGRGSILHYYLE